MENKLEELKKISDEQDRRIYFVALLTDLLKDRGIKPVLVGGGALEFYTMEEMMQLAANYGFPMVVAGYLLVRLEPLIKDLQKSVTLLTMVVARQSEIDVEKLRCFTEGVK